MNWTEAVAVMRAGGTVIRPTAPSEQARPSRALYGMECEDLVGRPVVVLMDAHQGIAHHASDQDRSATDWEEVEL